MRINLVTPFAEKDAAKALGARWDAAKKCWYIVDAPDLTPFSRWIPKLEAAMDASAPGNTAASAKPKSPAKPLAPAKSALVDDLADCGCAVLPWDDCVHTAKP